MSARMRNAVSLSIISTLGLLASACDEPEPTCTISSGTFGAKYTLVAGSATGTPDCAQLVGDVLNVNVYYQAKSSKDPQPDPAHASIAIEPATFVGAVSNAAEVGTTPDAADKAFGFGAFTTAHPKDDVCSVTGLNEARVRLPSIPAHESADAMGMCVPVGEAPAVDATYAFSNVNVFVSVTNQGRLFSADLTYSTPTCSAKYTVVAAYGPVPCAMTVSTGASPATGDLPDGAVVDAGVNQGMDGGLDLDSGVGDIGDVTADGGDDCPAPAAGDPPGPPDNSACAAANSDFATTCDPNLLFCVPTAPVTPTP